MSPLRKLLLALPLVLGVVVAHGQPNDEAKSAAKAVAEGAATKASAPDVSLVIAHFEGGRITLRDMQAAVANKAPLVRREIAAPGGRERFLGALERWDLLLLEAARRGYAADPQVIDAVGLTAINVMAQRDFAVDPASIPASDVERDFLETRVERPAVRRGSHIQVATEAGAREILREVSRDSHGHFARVAVARSTDARTGAQGGEFGYVSADGRDAEGRPVVGVPAEVIAALFAVAHEGDIAPEPIRHAGGFSVLLFSRKMPAFVTRLAEVEAAIRAKLAERTQKQALDALAAKLRAEAKPVVHPELLDLLVFDPKGLDIPSGFPAAPEDPRMPTRMMEPDGS